MLKRLRPRSGYDVLALLGFLIALGTGGAYAANTVGSADIINESILSADIKNGEVKNADLATSSVTSTKIYNGSVLNSEIGLDAVTSDKVAQNALTGSDIDESSLGVVPSADSVDGYNASEFIQGSGEVSGRRLILTPGQLNRFTVSDGIGAVYASCTATAARLYWLNTSGADADVWAPEYNPVRDYVGFRGTIVGPEGFRDIAKDETGTDHWDGATISVGQGSQPGKIATIHGFAFQSADNQPCGFQAQAIVTP